MYVCMYKSSRAILKQSHDGHMIKSLYSYTVHFLYTTLHSPNLWSELVWEHRATASASHSAGCRWAAESFNLASPGV